MATGMKLIQTIYVGHEGKGYEGLYQVSGQLPIMDSYNKPHLGDTWFSEMS